MKFSLLIFLFFVLIFELILCRVFVKRRKRNLNDFENKPSLSYSIEYPEQLNAKLIFCDQKYKTTALWNTMGIAHVISKNKDLPIP